MTAAPEAGRRLPYPRPRVGIVSSRHRLCAALGRPLIDAPALLAAQVEAAGASGVEFFQVREPDLDGGPLLALVSALVESARGRVRIVVNDRADVARVAGSGLHLKGASMPVARLRPWLPASTWISRAVHEPEDVLRAGAVDVLVAGTVHDTASKPDGTPRLGLAGLARVAAASTQPVFAIGGMTAADWPAVADAGAVGIAAIGWMLPRAGENAGAAVTRAMSDLRAVVDALSGLS